MRCKEYVEVDVDDIDVKNMIYVFEGNHRGHALITCDLDEVESYKKVVPQLLHAMH
ncbi:MAG: hypothetical protein ACFFBP_10665 [Promethearchaeota archaeon]